MPHADQLLCQVDIAHVESHHLRYAESCTVQQLEESAVPKGKNPFLGRIFDNSSGLGYFEEAGHATGDLGPSNSFRRIGRQPF